MDQTALVHFSVEQKNTGTVGFDLEGIPVVDKSPAHLSVTELKMASHPVDVDSSNEENRPGQPVTAKAGAIVAKSPVGCRVSNFPYTFHEFLSPDGFPALYDH
jgi:hypothetical protein